MRVSLQRTDRNADGHTRIRRHTDRHRHRQTHRYTQTDTNTDTDRHRHTPCDAEGEHIVVALFERCV